MMHPNSTIETKESQADGGPWPGYLLKSTVSTTNQFFKESTLHGFQYLGQTQNCLERIFWTLAILGAAIFSGYLIHIGVIQPLLDNPVLISFHPSEITIDQIPFPAFTICNVQRIKKSKMTEIRRIVDEYFSYVDSNRTSDYLAKFGKKPNLHMKVLKYLSTLCNGTNTFSRKTGYSGYIDHIEWRVDEDVGAEAQVNVDSPEYRIIRDEYFYKSLVNCSEMMLRCMWATKPYPCEQLFTPMTSGAGRCCVFNMMPEFVMRGLRKNDFQVSSDDAHLNDSVVEAWSNWNIDDDLFVSSSAHPRRVSEYPRHQHKAGMPWGLSVLIDPQLSEAICSESDSEGFRVEVHSPLSFPDIHALGKAVGPGEELFLGVRGEITTADPNQLKGYSYETRQCYFLGEKVLNTNRFYSKKSCIDECIANETWHVCQCILLRQPFEGNRAKCGSQAKVYCGEVVISAMRKSGIRNKCKACIPSCTSLEYTSELSKMPIRSDVGLWKNPNSGRDELWANKSLSLVHVFFTSDYVESRVRRSLYGVRHIIANAGGLLGLTLGFSLASLVEPLYFFTLRHYFDKRQR